MGGGVSTAPPLPFFAGFVRSFGAKPDSPRRASGEGLYGSDPPFLTAGAVSRGGGCLGTRCLGTRVRQSPPSPWGSLPSVFIPAGRLPGPLAGRDDDERRARPTDEQTSSGYRPLLSEIVRNFRL